MLNDLYLSDVSASCIKALATQRAYGRLRIGPVLAHNPYTLYAQWYTTMDSSLADEIAVLEDEFNERAWANYATVAVTVALLYDWVLCFGTEKESVWSRRPSAASVLYILARVSGSLSNIFAFALSQPVQDQDFSIILLYIVVAVFSAIRAHALSGRRRVVAAITLALTLVPIGVNAYVYGSSQIINYAPPILCSTISHLSPSVISIRGSPALFTGVGQGAICEQRHSGSSTEASRKTLQQVLVESGSWFFLTLLALNIVALILTQFDITVLASVYSIVREAASPLLISRFLLDLLSVARPEDESDGPPGMFTTDVRTLTFASSTGAVPEHYTPYAPGPCRVVPEDGGGWTEPLPPLTHDLV
ncbi:hypothetical protein C8Q77DRAFT_1158095 [Trametes polyzona]|nr:hypothetical protein C8Q77DRAFT_1158095 [Trametes polyzona]